MSNLVELQKIKKTFNNETILHEIDLNVAENEFLTLLGPSGCGKTTTLRIIGGFESITSGRLLFRDKDISTTPPHLRSINTVFQNYALFPHMDVKNNVAFGLKVKKEKPDVIKTKVEKMLDLVKLSEHRDKKISALSGGQQQRVAIARALVNDPELLLLDEPLGALDLQLRKAMQTELKSMQQHLGITFVYVTHDQEEALTMSDTIVVMNKGEILQKGTPKEIYDEPQTPFVANFIGTSNIIPGTMDTDYKVAILGTSFDCVDKKPGTSVNVVIRPEDMVIFPVGTSKKEKNTLQGIVESTVFFGVHYEMGIRVRDIKLKVHSTEVYKIGDKVDLFIEKDNIHIISAEAGGINEKEGDKSHENN